MPKEFELLKRLHEACTKLDLNYCTIINREDFSLAMRGEDYEEISDLLIEVEEFLAEATRIAGNPSVSS